MKEFKLWGSRLAAAFFFVLALHSPLALSQAITGDILGTVRDASGAVVPGAKVVLTQTATGVKFMATTDVGGNYLFAQLKPDHYSIAVSKEGFKTTTISDIDLQLGQRPRVDVVLNLGQVTQSVTVSAGGVQLLETQTSSMGQVVPQTAVANLPIVNRNFIALTTLSAGTAPIGSGNSPASYWTGAGSGNVTASVAGLRESNESFLVDGIESRNARFGSANLRPSFDAIQEVKVQTDNFSAEYGRSSAVINTTIKSGSNTLHGDAYDYVQNDIFNANDFFSNLNGLPKGTVRYNDFGASLGGPVYLPHLYNGRNRTFFFFNYEGIRNPTVSNATALVPSRAQLAGDLADNSVGTGIFPTSSAFCQANPTSQSCANVIDPSTGQPFPGNTIPSSRLDPVAQKWLQFWPAPNLTNPPINSANGRALYNYATTVRGYDNMDQENTRIDQTLTSKDQIWGSFTHDNRPHIAPGVMPYSGNNWPLGDDLLQITETHTFAPQVVNEGRFGYNRGKTYLVGLGALTTNFARDVFGFQNTSPNPFDFGVPDAGVAGFTSPGSPSESIGALDQDFQWVDNLSIVSGQHNIKLGVNYIHEKFYQITDFGGVPSFNFSGRYTQIPFGIGDFLLGDPESATSSVGDSSQDLRSNFYAGFLQDDWRIRRDLTLNLGVRYEYGQPPFDTSSKTAWFDPAVQQVVYSRSGGVRNGIVDPDYNNFAPRVGFAWSPSFVSNTVVRSSFGVFYATDNWNELQFMVIDPGFYTTQTLNSDPTKPTISLENIFPAGTLGGGTTVPFSIDKRNRTPYVQEWNFDVQHTFAGNWLVDVGYIGDVGQKLPQRRNEDGPAFDPTGTIPISQRVPFPAFSWILLTYNGGWSSYNGLATRVEHRFANGFYFVGSYTWSHAIDLGNTDDFSGSQCCFKVLDKGNGDYDVRHRVVLSYVYDLPFGRGRRFGSGLAGAMGKLAGGWSVSGITTFSTGQYMTPTLPQDWQVLGAFSSSRPDKIGPAYPAHQTYTDWLNLNSFVFPGCPSYVPCTPGLHLQGTAARNSLEMPGINNWDISLMKDTPISERFGTQFRAEFYNAWNHTQFGDACTSVSAGCFGVINSLGHSPRVIQLALKLLW
jgi:hypothetical protein